MDKIKKKLIEYLIPNKRLWVICGNIAERFYEKDSGDYDYLQEKFYSWIRFGIYNTYE